MRTVGIIPARFGSSRLPGKPLADIWGRPMIWWVYQRVMGIPELEEVRVATDDCRISQVCQALDIPVIMTSPDHPTAAHRLAEVSEKLPADFYLQLNGDEPLISRSAVASAVPKEIPLHREFGTNIITPMHDPAQVLDLSNIKVVFGEDYRALYMSRNPVPCPFRSIRFSYYKHVGIIGYNRKMLEFYASSRPGRFEQIEGIDTLRFIDYGKELRLIPVDHLESLSVDTEKDLEQVRLRLKNPAGGGNSSRRDPGL